MCRLIWVVLRKAVHVHAADCVRAPLAFQVALYQGCLIDPGPGFK